MKRLLQGLLISSICVLGANADYKLVLTDKDGVQTEQCIKSYSFSNNLEHIAKQKGVGQDIYSEEETLTNKVYLGKPVYRKLVTLPTNLVGNNTWRIAYYINPPSNIKNLLTARQVGSENVGISYVGVGVNDVHIKFYSTYMGYSIGSNRVSLFKGQKVLLEYTKNIDIETIEPTEFKSYLHYIPSVSTTGELINVDMKNLGVQLLEGYVYDDTTDSCNKN